MASGRRLRDALPALWVIGLTLLLSAPLLTPGFVLHYDMVFTPRQDLLPGAFGLGGGLPRAVPQDAVVALLELLMPGMLLQKVILLAIPLISGFGMLRLLAGAGRRASVVAATLAMLAPYVSERMLQGHWALLLAYAVTPWALHSAGQFRRHGSALDGLRLVLLVAVAGLTPTGSVLVTALVLPIAVAPGAMASVRARIAVIAAVSATWLPWLLPALVHPNAGASDGAGAEVFALRSEGAWGLLLTALGTGGIWNAEVVPVSRTLLIAPLVTLVLIALAILGMKPLLRVLGRTATIWWSVVAIAGLVAAIASGTALWAWLVTSVPGAGLLRDAHKLLAPLALLIAAAAGLGVARLARRVPDATGAGAVIVAALLLPLLLQPDVLWGAGGRLRPAEYPIAWSAVRERLGPQAGGGDVVVLPWTGFRRYPWNDDRTMLDPAPRWLPRTTVVADGLLVNTSNGLVEVSGDDPRAAAIGAALAADDNLVPLLQDLGIGWVLIDGPATLPTGVIPTYVSPELVLGRVPGLLAAVPPADGAGLVYAADALVLLGLLTGTSALVLVRVRGGIRRRSAKTLLP